MGMIIKKKHFQLSLWSIPWMVLLLSGCAQVSSPAGGAVDEDAPQLLSTVPSNGSIKTRPEVLRLSFDEFVLLRNASQQVLISPPIDQPPVFRTKGKQVLVEFDPDAFADETTYVVAFGDGIVDLHESNPAENLFFAFSTGEQLDTLRIGGSILEHLSGDGAEGMRVLFFRNPMPWDSIWAGQRPDAVASTNAEGQFEAAYLAPGSFKAIAVDDLNRDYQWNPGERVAWGPNEIASGDLLSENWLLAATDPLPIKPYIGSAQTDSTGMIRIFASLEDSELQENWNIHPAVESMAWERQQDSVFIWADGVSYWDSLQVIWSWEGDADTLDVRMRRKRVSPILTVRPLWPSKTSSKLSRKLTFDRALLEVDSTRWFLSEDTIDISLGLEDFELNSVGMSARSLEIRTTEQAGKSYRLVALPGAIKSREGWFMSDTLEWKWTTWPTDHFGGLQVALRSLPGQGWLSCTSKKNLSEARRIYCFGDTTLHWPLLEPGNYDVSFEWDENADSLWQAVDPFLLQRPESYFYLPKGIDVRSNWEVEWMWDFGDIEP